MSSKNSALGFNSPQSLAFSAPVLGIIFFMGPMGLIQGIYAKYYGLALTSLAAILLISRIFDAVTDPLIGYLSDRYREKFGTRKPFVLLGGLLLIPSSYFLYVPPDNVSIGYFAFWSLAFYLAFTIFNIPHFAWASELTTDSSERTAIFSTLSLIGQFGGALFFLVPLLPIFTTSEFTPETLQVSVLIGSCLIIPSLYISLKYAPNGKTKPRNNKEVVSSHKDSLLSFYAAIKKNKPFQIFLAAYLFYGLGMGMWGGLFFIFIDAFLGLGKVYAQMALIGVFGGLLATPLCYKLALKIGKKNTWFISSCIVVSGIGYTGLLHPEDANFIDLLILQVILTIGTIFGAVVSPAMLSDTIDYGLLKDNTERSGTYFAVFNFLVKGLAALGSALGLAIAGWLGFDATSSDHSETSILGMHLAIAWVPLLICSLSLIFIWLSPLNERRCAIISRRLSARAKKQMNTIPNNSLEESMIDKTRKVDQTEAVVS